MLEMPVLETLRLLIRPFVLEDLDGVHRLLDIELRDTDLRTVRFDRFGSGQWESDDGQGE